MTPKQKRRAEPTHTVKYWADCSGATIAMKFGGVLYNGRIDKDGIALMVRHDLLPTARINWLAQIMDGEPK